MVANTFQHYFVGLLAVANNLSALPMFLSLVVGLGATQFFKVSFAASFSSLLIMIISMYFGTTVLSFFGISMSAFQIAGGVLLCSTGMSMLNSKSASDIAGKSVDSSNSASAIQNKSDITSIISQAIVPISMPLTTGAGTISTVTLFSETAGKTHTNLELLLAIAAVATLNFFVFHYAVHLIRILGQVGMNVMLKVMGLFTLAIGVQFIVEGGSKIYLGLVH